MRRIVCAGVCTVMTGLCGICGAQEPAIAVLDSGTNDATVNVVGGFNFVAGTDDTSDSTASEHGTTVSRIIDQEDPGVRQYQFVVTDSSLTPSAAATDAAVLNAASNSAVGIIAYTAATISSASTAIPVASQAGKFIAIRAGDAGGDNPAVGAVAASGLNGVAIVTATDATGAFLPASNACGVTASRCIGVRGTTALSSDSGTGFAAARLAGIAAAVLKAAPFLSAEQLSQVLFATAQDTGDPRLGHGFILNADQIINSPAGPTSIPSGSGGGGGSSGSALAIGALVVGAAAGAALLSHNHGKLEKTMVLDAYGRPFRVDLTKLITIDDQRSSISSFFNTLDERQGAAHVRLDDHNTLVATYNSSSARFEPGRYFAMEGDPAFADQGSDLAFSLSGKYPDGLRYQIDRNRDPALGFGITDSVYQGSTDAGSMHFLSSQTFTMPVLSFGTSADSAAVGFAPRKGFGVGFGLVNTNDHQAYGHQSVAAVLEGSYRFHDRGKVSLQVGRLQEDGSLFGGASGGAFSVAGTNTLAASVSGSLRIGDHARLIGDYGVARSDVSQSQSALLKDFSTINSNWFGLGLVLDHLFDSGDQFGVAVSQPLRVTGGQVNMTVPYARDFAGNIYSSVDRISLVPDGREHAFESYYLHNLGGGSSVGAYFMVRTQPDNIAGAAPELTALATYRARF